MAHGLKRMLDYSDYLVTPDDGKRYEILAGELYVTPAPRPRHQRVACRLLRVLDDYFGARRIGEVLVAPTDVILDHHDIVQPDLLVVGSRRQITGRGIEGAPLVVVEIASPSTARRDRGIKARRYADLGVRHYWIVDPESRRLDCHRLAGSTFTCIASAEEDERLAHPDFEGLVVDLARLWAESEAPDV